MWREVNPFTTLVQLVVAEAPFSDWKEAVRGSSFGDLDGPQPLQRGRTLACRLSIRIEAMRCAENRCEKTTTFAC